MAISLPARFLLMSPLIFIAVVKLPLEPCEPILKDILASMLKLAPGSEAPPADMLQILAGVELVSALFVTFGVVPQLFNTIAFLQYMTPIFLLKGDFSQIGQLYCFVLALHAACGLILFFDAWAPAAKGLKRIAGMQPFLFVAVIKYSPGLLKAHMDAFADLAPKLEAPPADIMNLMGYFEFASILLVVSGTAPKLFNLIAALQYMVGRILHTAFY